MPFAHDSDEIGTSQLTLDFFGTPKLIIKKKNAFPMLHNNNIVVKYRFNDSYTLIKPLGLSLTFFAFYLVAIAYSRISLSFSEPAKTPGP